MARQNFKQLFSIVVALILGALGLTLGFALETYIKQADPGSTLHLFQDAAINHSYYLNAIVTSLGIIGLLIGVVVAPKVADRLVDTGNAVERMSAKDKFAVGLGAFVGLLASSSILLPVVSGHGQPVAHHLRPVLPAALYRLRVPGHTRHHQHEG